MNNTPHTRIGITGIEFGLITALIAVAAITALQGFGSTPDRCTEASELAAHDATRRWREEHNLRAEVRHVNRDGRIVAFACFWDGRPG